MQEEAPHCSEGLSPSNEAENATTRLFPAIPVLMEQPCLVDFFKQRGKMMHLFINMSFVFLAKITFTITFFCYRTPLLWIDKQNLFFR